MGQGATQPPRSLVVAGSRPRSAALPGRSQPAPLTQRPAGPSQWGLDAAPAERPTAQRCEAAVGTSYEDDGMGAGAVERGGPVSRNPVLGFLQAFWKFLRPHTIRGTVLGTSMVVTRVLLENKGVIDWTLLPRAALGLAALLCGNGYIVGINQIYDVDIDTVNKPFLPVAAGELSPKVAWMLCLGLAGLGTTLAYLNFGPFIAGLYSFGLLLGTVYSVPPLRLKQNAVAAFMIIATVRGFLLNFGVYYATRAALGMPFVWSPAIIFITVFVTVFATVIAITKDLPDVEGDKAYGIDTFATRLGVEKIAWGAVLLLMSNYVGAVAAAVLYPAVFNRPIMGGMHAIFGCILLTEAWKMDKRRYHKKSIQSFYRSIWNLFYSEYLLLPLL